MSNRDKNIARLAVVAAILALNLLGLSVASSFLLREDVGPDFIVLEREGPSAVRLVHVFGDEEQDNDHICEADCSYCDEDIMHQIVFNFAFGRGGGARTWRNFASFWGLDLHSGGIVAYGDGHVGHVYGYGNGAASLLGGDAGDAANITGIGFLGGDGVAGGEAFDAPRQIEPGAEDDVGGDAEDVLENGYLAGDDPPHDENDPQDSDGMSDDGQNQTDGDGNDGTSSPSFTHLDSPQNGQSQPEQNPQTSDDFSIFGLVASAVGLLLSLAVLAIAAINKKAARAF